MIMPDLRTRNTDWMVTAYSEINEYRKALGLREIDANGNLINGNPEDIYSGYFREPQSRGDNVNNSEVRWLVDVQTYYNIVKRRANCEESYPRFEKQATMQYFDNIITFFVPTPTYYHVLDLYLLINAKILDIPVSDTYNEQLILPYDYTRHNESVKKFYEEMNSRSEERNRIINDISNKIMAFP